MTTVVIQNPGLAFGALTNNTIGQLFNINAAIGRLSAAIANASSDYSGTAGTEYEGAETLFGVVADPNNAGAQGQAYASAITTIVQNWQTFWTAAQGAIDTIDNGVRPLS
jgi:hypothetical protein